MGAQFKFDRFVVDGSQRQLKCDGSPVEVNSRYLDALLLMVRNPGELITRDRFLDDVWSGIPVTDEALSQCIANLRRTLGDDATQAALHRDGAQARLPLHRAGRGAAGRRSASAGRSPSRSAGRVGFRWRRRGTLGGGVVGVAGGLLYGLGASPDPLRPAVGAASFLIVMLSVNIFAAALAGFAIGAGIAAAHRYRRSEDCRNGPRRRARRAGRRGAAKLLGIDAFSVLLGKAPVGIAGGFEGLVLGGAIGLGSHLSIARVGPGRRFPAPP